MARNYAISFFLVVISCLVGIQSLYGQSDLYGIAAGGANDKYAIFKIKTDGSGFTKLFDFDGANGYSNNSLNNLIQLDDGYLVGMTQYGGTNDYGVLFKIKTDGTGYTKLIDFNGTNGRYPYANVMLASNGYLYGMTNLGGVFGVNGYGLAFRIKPDGTGYTKLLDFDLTNTGGFPEGNFIEVNGVLYGLVGSGGASSNGTMFKINLDGSGYAKILDFDGSTKGSNPHSMMKASNGYLYGLTWGGGANGKGTIFKLKADGTGFTKVFDFDGSTTGSNPYGYLVESASGQMFGMTENGGASGYGTAFMVDQSGTNFVKLFDLDNTNNGRFPYGSLVQAPDGTMYGTTWSGGTKTNGTIFKISKDGFAYTKLYDFDVSANGLWLPSGNLTIARSSQTIIFPSLDQKHPGDPPFNLPDTSNAELPLSYVSSDPAVATISGNTVTIVGAGTTTITASQPGNSTYFPATSVAQSLSVTSNKKGMLWGITSGGGSLNQGTIFSVNSDGTNYSSTSITTDLSMGAWPQGSLVKANNDKFYGLTIGGGDVGQSNGYLGVLFEFDPVTDTYTKKIRFTESGGNTPTGSLTLASNGKLYGMTRIGGASGGGVIFEYDPSNNSYVEKFNFNYSGGFSVTGFSPFGSLIQASNGKLYGLTNSGGQNSVGTLFEYNITTNTFTKKIDFDRFVSGAYPYGDLVEGADGLLYGMTAYGGTQDLGCVFSFNPATGIFFKNTDFFGEVNGAYPNGGLVQASNGKLYGMTRYGGANNNGTIFEFNPSIDGFTKKFEFESSTTGTEPLGNLIESSNGKLYGMTSLGGAQGSGVLFEFDPATGLSKKSDFNFSTGDEPRGSLLFSKQTQKITFNSLPVKNYGDPPFALSAISDAGLAVTFTSSDHSVATVTGNVVTMVSPGAATIVAHQSGDVDTFMAQDVSQVLNVLQDPVSGKSTQIITFDAPAQKSYGDPAFDLTATSSSGLPVSYFTNDPTIATIRGSTVTIMGMGIVTITASQGGNQNFKRAADVQQFLIIGKASAHLAFTSITNKTLGDPAFNLAASAKAPVMFSSVSHNVTISGTLVTMVKPGRVTIEATSQATANYATSSVDRSFCINPVKPVISRTSSAGAAVLSSSNNEGNQWYFNYEAIAGATGKQLEVSKDGSYIVQTTIEGCSGTYSDPYPFVVTGSENAIPKSSISIFPNPSHDFFTIQITNSTSSHYTYEIIDLLGRHIEEKNVITDELNKIDMQGWASGLYIIKVMIGHDLITRQLVKD